MGKKPVLGLFGLVCATTVLTGCGQCCRTNTASDSGGNARFSPSSTFGSKPTTPAPGTGVAAGPGPAAAPATAASTTTPATTPAGPTAMGTAPSADAKTAGWDTRTSAPAADGGLKQTSAMGGPMAAGMTPPAQPGNGMTALGKPDDRNIGSTSSLPLRSQNTMGSRPPFEVPQPPSSTNFAAAGGSPTTGMTPPTGSGAPPMPPMGSAPAASSGLPPLPGSAGPGPMDGMPH
jgi:hypothetical protein